MEISAKAFDLWGSIHEGCRTLTLVAEHSTDAVQLAAVHEGWTTGRKGKGRVGQLRKEALERFAKRRGKGAARKAAIVRVEAKPFGRGVNTNDACLSIAFHADSETGAVQLAALYGGFVHGGERGRVAQIRKEALMRDYKKKKAAK